MIVRIALCAIAAIVLQAPAVSAQTAHIAAAGPGISDVSPHQLVRTSKNILYAIVPDCPAIYPCGPNKLHAYKANTVGIASGYTEQDAAHAPAGSIRSSAIAVDSHNRIHVAWSDMAGTGHIYYSVFNTATKLWGRTVTLQTTNFQDPALPTAEGIALALDASGNPHVAWSARGASSSAPVRLWYSARAANRWSKPIVIDDQAVPANGRLSLHPALAYTAAGELLITWLQGSLTVVLDDAYYTPDGTIYVRTLTNAGLLGQTTSIPDLAMTTIDNGPSIMVTPDGTQHLTFASGIAGQEDQIRYWYNTGKGWQGDQQPPAQVTHDPSLGPDGNGGVRIYGHGSPGADYAGVGLNMYYFAKPAASTAWTPWTLYTTGQYDCSVSTRWSQFFQYFPNEIDILFWSDPANPFVLFVGSEP